MTVDAFLLELTPEPTLEVARSVRLMRDALAAATTDLLAIPDSTLETAWPWREDEADVRYGLYRTIEAVEATTVDMTRILRDTGARRAAGAERIAPTAIAHWDLQGLLATLDDSVLDRHPGNGEWTAREALGHIVSGQRASGWFTAWWAARPADEPTPDRIPETVIRASGLPDDEAEGAGTLAEIRSRLSAVADLSAGRLAYLDDADLALPSRWASFPVTIGFRLGRWSSHLVEHTVQLDKTLARMGQQPSEVERLVRRLHGTYGRLEAVVHPMPADLLAIADERGCTVDRVLGELAAELTAVARSARAATGTA